MRAPRSSAAPSTPLVGHWPDDAWMTFDRSREGERLGRGIYRWAGERWREVRRHRHETRGLFTPRDITFSWRGTTFFGTYADGEARLCGLLSFGKAGAPFATSGCSPDLLERGDRGPSPSVLRSSGTSRPARPGAAWPCLVPARRPETAAPSANFA
ncbi:MAG TPA: hypothetical protein VFS43_09320 [Polyangiaceae bacterium]|nr:hypothetical protein [Polyangiaceae bacterium]